MTTTTTTVTEVQDSAFGNLTAMFLEPSRAFSAVEKRSMVWLPLTLTLLSTTVILLWYFQSVDFAWLLDRMTATIPDPAAREKVASFMTKSTMQTSGVAGAFVVTFLVYILMAAYFLLVAKIRKLEFGFTKWFSFVAWASVPSLLLLPLAGMQILLAHNGQIGLDQLNPVTLNQLVFHIEMGRPWASLLDSINIASIWTAVLMVVGFQTWSKSSRSSSVMVVAIPYAVIYAVWGIVSLMSKAV
ncbi:MAG: YIP1 family protein [Pseudomonadota bacterium]